MGVELRQIFSTNIVQALGAANAPTLANPFATISDLGGSAWVLSGNTLGNDTSWLGSADNHDILFKTNNTERARFLKTGAFGIGLVAPTATLHIKSGGTTNATYAFKIIDSGATSLLSVYDSGQISAGNTATTNLFVGLSSGLNTTSGVDNTAFGVSSLQTLTTGNGNTAVGRHSLLANLSGGNNIGIGADALVANISGSNNVAIGVLALADTQTSSDNIGIGTEALEHTTTGTLNVAIGSQTMEQNTTGSYNTAGGYQAIHDNTSGSYNVGIGLSAMFSNRDGNYNAVIGEAAYYTNISGSSNTILGFQAGYNNKGDGNVFLGKSAGRALTATSNKLYIDNNDNTIPLIFGDFSTMQIGLGTVTPNSVSIIDIQSTTKAVRFPNMTTTQRTAITTTNIAGLHVYDTTADGMFYTNNAGNWVQI